MSSHEPYSATASVPPLPYFKSCNNVTISTKYAVNSSQLFLQSNSVVTTLCLLDKFCILHGKISSNLVGMELIFNKWGQSFETVWLIFILSFVWRDSQALPQNNGCVHGVRAYVLCMRKYIYITLKN